ncbi:MAG: hypothetical protein ABR599_11210 [Gemmatimonadota bacterium]
MRLVLLALAALAAPGHLPGQTELRAPASATPAQPVPYASLEEGERVIVEVEGGVRGPASALAGGIRPGALVGLFEAGPPFLVAVPATEGTRLLWTAPADGRLAFAVEPAGAGELSGGYDLRITELGRRGDARQRRFPAPWIGFLPRTPDALVTLAFEDRAGFGLDRRTLKVFLDTERGRRFVLSDAFDIGARGARLTALPPEVVLPPGVHRVSATIGDALGNTSPPAMIFLDRP